jgi:hypothetical protein
LGRFVPIAAAGLHTALADRLKICVRPILLAALIVVPVLTTASTFNQIPVSESDPYIFRLSKAKTNQHTSVDLFETPYGTAVYCVGTFDGNELLVDAIYQFTTDPSWDVDQAGVGGNSIVWDGRTGDGREVPRGVYFCQVRVGRSKSLRKMLLVD